MRIAIAGYQDVVCGAWQLSQTLKLYTIDVPQGAVIHEGSHPFPGVAAAGEWLIEKQVKAVLMGTIDPDDADPIADRGIHVFTGADEVPPDAIAEHFLVMLRGAAARGRGGCCGAHESHDEAGCCGGHGHEAHDEDGGCCGGGGEDCCGGTGHDDPDHECRCK